MIYKRKHNKEHNSSSSKVSDCSNKFFNLRIHYPNVNEICLYAKDQYEGKYPLLVKKHKGAGLENYNDTKAFIEYSNDMNDAYKNSEKYNRNEERKNLTVFDDIIAD